jgi:nicotinamidase-related amidase
VANPVESRHSALVLIDLMPRIIDRPTAPRSGPDVLRQCLRLAEAFRAANRLVVFVRVERPGVEVQPPGSELAPECAPQPGDLEIVKRTIGAFGATELDNVLEQRGIDTIVLGGLVTNFGVESTGRAGADHGYDVIFVEDAMAGLDEHAHQFAVEYVFPRVGWVASSEQVLAAL